MLGMTFGWATRGVTPIPVLMQLWVHLQRNSGISGIIHDIKSYKKNCQMNILGNNGLSFPARQLARTRHLRFTGMHRPYSQDKQSKGFGLHRPLAGDDGILRDDGWETWVQRESASNVCFGAGCLPQRYEEFSTSSHFAGIISTWREYFLWLCWDYP